MGEALERVEEDRAEAEYIDTEGEDAAYVEALERVRRVLQREESTPEQGLVVYAGVVDGEVVSHVFDDLPTPVSGFVYERDNEFDTGPLEAVAAAEGTYGLLVVERGGAALGLARGDDVTVVETIDSDVMGKTRAGGQSAQRFARERERQKEAFFESVADEAERAFLGEDDAASASEGAASAGDTPASASDSPASTNADTESASATADVDGLLLGGTSVTVDDFREGGHLDHRLEDLLVGDPVSVEYASEQGLRQLVETASDRVEDEQRRETREALDRFFEGLHADVGSESGDAGSESDDESRSGDEVVYGREAVEEALTYDAVETLLVSADLPAGDVRELEERASNEGGDCVVVPADFDRGRQFREAFGGVAAILRFPVE